MKTMFIVFAFAAFVAGQKNPLLTVYKVTIDNAHKFTCIGESHANAGLVKNIENNKLLVKDIKQNELCYMSCMLKNSHLLDKNGHLDVGKITKDMPADLQKDVNNNHKPCKDKVSKESCNALKVLECLNNSLKKKYNSKIFLEYKGQ